MMIKRLCVEPALEISQVNEFAEDWDRNVGDACIELSDGQKQRIAIARAIVRRPKVFVLDEATSAIDAKIEDTILQRVEALGCTLIIISHRLSTINKADRIVVVSGGEIVDEGSHMDLCNRCSYYKELISKQIIK
ncbi:MAG: ATP-binding cassette domain-containing protein [Candidatus Eisenbacteria sp.]|nr:ATP-binding cassette domain-containing protein [Candidatus Eisenbacteria bacterium]